MRFDSTDVYAADVFDTTNDAYYLVADPKDITNIGVGINDSQTIIGRYVDSSNNS